MLRKKTSEKDPVDWFAFAAKRLRAADVLWSHEGLTATGIEALQEAVERFLKGYLIAKGWKLAKTHDLTHLPKEANRLNPRFGQFEELTGDLTEDFFAQHYPGMDTGKIGENYETLRQQTGELVTLIRESLPQYFTSQEKP
jgi:HEPN domain-containing protein